MTTNRYTEDGQAALLVGRSGESDYLDFALTSGSLHFMALTVNHVDETANFY